MSCKKCRKTFENKSVLCFVEQGITMYMKENGFVQIEHGDTIVNTIFKHCPYCGAKLGYIDDETDIGNEMMSINVLNVDLKRLKDIIKMRTHYDDEKRLIIKERNATIEKMKIQLDYLKIV